MKGFLSFLILCTLSSCLEIKKGTSYLTLKSQEQQSNHRIPSSQFPEKQQCLVDTFDLNFLKNEIKYLESKWKNQKVTIPSKFNFATKLTTAQKTYIKKYHEYIKINELSKQCDDLICILNSAYGKLSGEEGHRIYYFFLQTGYSISTNDTLPDFQKMTDKAPKDFLFTNNELKIFNLLPSLIHADFFNHKLISSFHRFPNGTSPGPLVAGQYQYSWSHHNNVLIEKKSGRIYLTNQSTKYDDKKKLYTGYFIHTLIHELGHALDYNQGELYPPHYSDSSDWKKGNWLKYEVKTENKTVATEIPNESAKFVSEYAKTSSKEDFAETSTFFYYNPKHTFEKVPNKGKLFSYKFENKKNYQLPELKKLYADEIVNHLTTNLIESYSSCLDGSIKQYKQNQQFFTFTHELSYLGSETLNCLNHEFSMQALQIIQKQKQKHYYACHYYGTDSEEQMIASLSPEIEEKLLQFVDQSMSDHIRANKEKYQEFNQHWQQNCDPVYFYLNNYQKKGEISNYSNDLEQCIREQMQDLGLIYDDLTLNAVLKSYPLEKAQKLTYDFFHDKLIGIENVLSTIAKKRWNHCTTNDAPYPHDLSSFHGENNFVQPNTLYCLNHHFLEDIQSGLTLHFQSPLDEGTLAYLQDNLSTTYQAEMRTIIMNAQQKEMALVDTFKQTSANQFHTANTSKASILDIAQSGEFAEACQYQGYRYYLDLFNKKHPEPTTTIDLSEHMGELAVSDCSKLQLIYNSHTQQETEYLNKQQAPLTTSITKKLTDSTQWLEHYPISSDFISFCQSETKDIIHQTLKENIDLNQLFFKELSQLTSDYQVTICQELKIKHKDAIDQLDREKLEQAAPLLQVMRSDLTWAVGILTEKELTSKCLNEFKNTQVKLPSIKFVPSHYIQESITHLACSENTKEWKKIELELLKTKLINHEDVHESSIKDYLEKSKQFFVFSLELQLLKEIENLKKECEQTYNNIRINHIKLKREQCIKQTINQKKDEVIIRLMETNKTPSILKSQIKDYLVQVIAD
jgi:hypothetical protein